jgi:hypothetical protein
MSFNGATLFDAITCPVPAAVGSSGGAWMYPCSGAAYFENLGSYSEVFTKFTRGQFPSGTLSNFLHEATHHHCFDSLTGMMLLAARIAAQYAGAFRFECQSRKGKTLGCVNNVSCCNRVAHGAGLALLQPIAEGLAMYGQCDAFPGASPVATPMTHYVMRAYLQSEIKELARRNSSDLASAFRTDAAWRATADFIEGERSRNCSAFDRDRKILEARNSRHEIYWRGYEFIRSLAAIVDPGKTDTDATLGFISSFFFHDAQLAAGLASLGLSPMRPIPSERSITKIAEYMLNRVNRLREDAGWRNRCVDEYRFALLSGLHPENVCSYAVHKQSREVANAFMMNCGLEMTAKMSWKASARNRRNFKFGSLMADKMQVCRGSGKVRCGCGDYEFEIDGLRQGFPWNAESVADEYISVDGSKIVEFVFLDGYAPAVALYNGHSLIGLASRDLSKCFTSEDDNEAYGDLSPALAFWHDMSRHKAIWNPDPDSPCGRYYAERRDEAAMLGLRICQN